MSADRRADVPGKRTVCLHPQSPSYHDPERMHTGNPAVEVTHARDAEAQGFPPCRYCFGEDASEGIVL